MATNSRSNGELQAGAVPGYYLSAATTDQGGSPQQQISAMFEPNELLGVDGLSAGGRWVVGGDEGGHVEPMLRYRTNVDEDRRVGLGVVAWGASHDGSNNGASYEAQRVGLEAGTDVRLTPESHWAEVHWIAAASVTAMDASGSYCADENGEGMDCGDEPDAAANATADVSGLHPAAMAGLAVDVGSRFKGPFHGVRVFAMAGGGWMPSVRAGEEPDRVPFHSAGGGIQLTLGAPKK